jgi:glycosyltransferase involved in cell wall biosynthesis
MQSPSVLLLIPAYNEEKRIRPVLENYVQYVREHYDGHFQIVVVVNGSRDRTVDVVREVGRQYPEVNYVEIPEAVGKGGALIEGLKMADKADLIGFVDADGATGPDSFLGLVRRCKDVDCVVGSRRMPESMIHQFQPSHRQFASKVFHVIVQLLFHMNIKDTQCGAKVMKQEAVQSIHDCLHLADMAFDVNLLYSLKKAGFTMVEAPVDWTDFAGSKVRFFRTSLVMLLSVIRLRIYYSPFYFCLKLVRPLEAWIYKSLRNPPPLQ